MSLKFSFDEDPWDDDSPNPMFSKRELDELERRLRLISSDLYHKNDTRGYQAVIDMIKSIEELRQ